MDVLGLKELQHLPTIEVCFQCPQAFLTVDTLAWE